MPTISIKTRLLIGASLIALLVMYFDIGAVLKSLSQLNLRWVLLTSLALIISTFLGAVNAYLLVSIDQKISFREFLPIYWASWALGLVIPGQVGDVASLTIMLKKFGIHWHAGLGRVALDKVISLTIMLLLGCYAIVVTLKLGSSLKPSLFLFALIMGVIISILLWKKDLIVNIFNRYGQKIGGMIAKPLAELVTTWKNNPRRILLNIFLTMIKVIIITAAYWTAFSAAGYPDLDMMTLVPLVALSSLVAYIPISINGLGTVELTGILLFSTMGIPEVAILTSYIMLRILGLLTAWIPAGIWLMFPKQ